MNFWMNQPFYQTILNSVALRHLYANDLQILNRHWYASVNMYYDLFSDRKIQKTEIVSHLHRGH